MRSLIGSPNPLKNLTSISSDAAIAAACCLGLAMATSLYSNHLNIIKLKYNACQAGMELAVREAP
jgi:hypothetical protein